MIQPASIQPYTPPAAPAHAPAPEKKGAEELTTVTTHCHKKHKHTPQCPHTTFTRPATEAERSRLLDRRI